MTISVFTHVCSGSIHSVIQTSQGQQLSEVSSRFAQNQDLLNMGEILSFNYIKMLIELLPSQDEPHPTDWERNYAFAGL